MKTLIAMLAAASAITARAQRVQPTEVNATPDTSYWSDSQRGWHFYEAPEPTPSAPPPPQTAPMQPTQHSAPEISQFEQLQKTLNNYRHVAIMNPNERNVRRYMELESAIVNRASLFADVAQRIAWATPELDPTLHGRPVNAKALAVFEQEQSAARLHAVARLANDHVLFFFFRSDCPYCHAFTPTLEAFQSKYGLTVVPVSIDGGGLPAFPSPRRDNGIARTLQVSQVPALFLAQPFTGKIAPIGFGVLSESQLLERIAIVANPQSEAPVSGIAQSIPSSGPVR